MLKHKKHNTQTEWFEALEAQRQFAETPAGINRAEDLITIASKRLPEGYCIYGWSGGKDALALQGILECDGRVTDCTIGTIGWEWEFPSFTDYVRHHAPKGLDVKDLHITADYLNSHEELCFPEDPKSNYKWYGMCEQNSYKSYAAETGADYIIIGRRKLDGNFVADGKFKNQIYPIFDFTHEDVFLLLSYFKIDLPDIYYYPHGFYHGTGSWITRYGATGEVMDDLMRIDPDILPKHRDVNKINRYLTEKGIL